ncbi:MAG: type 1 glutamine amidotransferase domain-containing protein [Pseudomonadota bacterium]
MFHKILRGALWCALLVLVLAGCAYARYLSFGLDQVPKANPHAVASVNAGATRGRILAVVTSKKAGYELTELARAWHVFRANGYDVEIASPQGGTPPVRIDKDDMGDSDYAFLNDKAAQARVAATLRLAEVDPARYAAVYFVGGKGAMFDFPGNPDIARIVAAIAPRGVVGAVCHGPAALAGLPAMAGKRMTGFSNAEEFFFRKDAAKVYPFLLEDKIGAGYTSAPLFLDHTVVDGRVVTGQNPWSTWSTTEAMIAALGHTPVARDVTGEEYSVRMIAAYYRGGMSAARAEQAGVPRFDKMLVLLHALIAGMEWRPVDAFQLQRLANR